MLNDPPEPAPAPLDLLVVGGLTVDRFADGREEPGGSVLHITRALAARGVRVGVASSAGPEPTARRGVDELGDLAEMAEIAEIERSITFRHREYDGRRRLWLEHAPEAIRLPPDAYDRIRTRAIVFAPVAGEIVPDTLTVWDRNWPRAALLQGWLRAPGADRQVIAQPSRTLPPEARAALAEFELLVASREDLAADGDDPHDQLRALRAVVGSMPALVVTDGADGAWIEAPRQLFATDPWHLPQPWRVDGVATVGAGDIFAAGMMAGGDWDHLPGREFLTRHAEAAMRLVAEVLEGRRPSP